VQISHLDGHKVVLSASGVTIPGQVKKMKGEGMPLFDHPNKRGDLYVTYTVRFPKSLSETQKALVREHFKPAHDEL
jgi:DnaJ-class molecular chaperone